MNIPEIQDELRLYARSLEIPRLEELADELSRRKPVRKSEKTSRRCDAKLRREIVEYAYANPELPFVEIARVYNVNPGRVSEALNGFRN